MAIQATRMLLRKISNPFLLSLSSVSPGCLCLSTKLNQVPEFYHLFFPTQLQFNIPSPYLDTFSGLKEMMGPVENKRYDSDDWSREKLENGSDWENEDEGEGDWEDSDDIEEDDDEYDDDDDR